MLQSFLTAVDPSSIRRKDDTEHAKLKETVRGLVTAMAPYREVCAQAALNIGLPPAALDFDRILKFTTGEGTASSLGFTCTQLKALHKEWTRLRKSMESGESCRPVQRDDSRSNTRKETLIAQQDRESVGKFRQVVQEELALRARLRELNSSNKVEKKKEFMKKRAEKAKTMNKHAFKIYKNYKLQQEKSFDFFKIDTIYTETQQPSLQVPPNLHEKKYLSTLKHSPREDQDNGQLMKVSIMRNSYVLPSSFDKCKTAATRTRIQCNQPTIDSPDSSLERFAEYRRKEAQTRHRKEELEKQRQEQALYRLIKKSEKLFQIDQRHQKDPQNTTMKEQQITRSDSNTKTVPPQSPTQTIDLDLTIQKKIEEKKLRKEAHLREQVNRIREDQKQKEERREQHRLKRMREHEEKITLNEMYLKSHLARCQTLKQNDYRHEMTIRRRHELQHEKEVDTALFSKVSRLTDQQLLKSIQRLDHPIQSRSPFSQNPNTNTK